MEKRWTILVELQCYAPGDGALSFTFTEKKYDRMFDRTDIVASSQPVELVHVIEYMKKHQDDLKDFWILNINSQWRAVKKVVRGSTGFLLMDNNEYRYKVEPIPPHGDILISNMFVELYQHARQDWIRVRNVNVLGALKYFLTNEEKINKALEENHVGKFKEMLQ